MVNPNLHSLSNIWQACAAAVAQISAQDPRAVSFWGDKDGKEKGSIHSAVHTGTHNVLLGSVHVSIVFPPRSHRVSNSQSMSVYHRPADIPVDLENVMVSN